MQSTYIYLGAINENNISRFCTSIDHGNQDRYPNVKHIWIYQKKKYIKRRRNLCSIEPEIYIFKFSSSWRRSEAREKRKFLRLPTNSRLNFQRRMTTEGSIPHVIFYRKWLSFVGRWKFASPRNLQLPKIRLEKYNLSSLGVFYREHFIRCFLKDHKFRKSTSSIRDNSRSQIVRDWSPFNSRISVDDSRRKLTRGGERGGSRLRKNDSDIRSSMEKFRAIVDDESGGQRYDWLRRRTPTAQRLHIRTIKSSLIVRISVRKTRALGGRSTPWTKSERWEERNRWDKRIHRYIDIYFW